MNRNPVQPELQAVRDQVARGLSRPAVVATLLGLATLAVFARAVPHEFIELDDKAYVVLNRRIHPGPVPSVVAWSLWAPVGGNWHPLTVLSHATDCLVYGLNPWGHHFTSVLVHALAVSLAVGVLWLSTGRLVESALAAALWGWHPLRVESVAWVAERKDVLAMFFWMAAMASYVAWVRRPSPSGRLATALLVALGLASKPLLVTFPAAMMLWDAWPLGRYRSAESWRERVARLGRFAAEKAELWVLAAATMAVTMAYQASQGAVMAGLSLGFRLSNALQSSVEYLLQMAWPDPLFLPHLLADRDGTAGPALVAAGVLVGVSLAALGLVRVWPALLMGWCWYLGTLMPMAGLVQAGFQSSADRYTYLPQFGLTVALVWGAASLCRPWPVAQQAGLGLAGVLLLGLAATTLRQLGFWADSRTLFTHTLDCEPDNYFAHVAVGRELARQERLDQARVHFEAATRRSPRDTEAHFSLGEVHLKLAHFELAVAHFNAAIAGRPATGWPAASAYLAEALSLLGHMPAARAQLQQAVALDPTLAPQLETLARLVEQPDRDGELLQRLQQALARSPDDPRVALRLARILASHPQAELRDPPRALGLARLAAGSQAGQQPYWLDTLALAQAANGQFSAALKTAQQARPLARAWAERDSEWGALADQVEARIELYRRGRRAEIATADDLFWLAVPLAQDGPES